MASGAEVVASRLLRVLGYHVPDNHIAFLHPGDLVIGPQAMYTPYLAKPRRMRVDDVERLLRGAARSADGSYRVLASLALPGRPVGGFRFHGTRSDDPNDIVPHEHRRELRGLAVFSAWINHVDARGANTLDTVVTADGRTFVKHHLLDFGSTFGSASLSARPYWEGHAYAFTGGGHLFRNIATLGLATPAFRDVPVFEHPALGRLPALEHAWDPREWKSRVPNPAFARMRPDDAFWAARRVGAFSDDMLRAVVAEGRYSDPAAAEYLATWLMRRRDAIVRAYLPAVNPIVHVQLSGDGVLTFENAAVMAGVAPAPASYEADWMLFDNQSRATTSLGSTSGGATSLRAPEGLPASPGSFVQVGIRATRCGAPVVERAGAGVVPTRRGGMGARGSGAPAVTACRQHDSRVALFLLACACCGSSVLAQPQPRPSPQPSSVSDTASLKPRFTLSVEAVAEIPTNRMIPQIEITRMGGLSGLAYDPTRGHWIAVADSRGTPRAFSLDFVVDATGFRVRVIAAHGIVRGPSAQLGGVLDFEGIAILPNGRIILSSEGDQRTDEVSNPSLIEVGPDFGVRFEIPVRDRYLPRLAGAVRRGVRDNAAFESLAVTPDGMHLFTGVEEPLRQDDERQALGRGALGRIAELVRDDDRFVPGREFVYPLEPLRAPASVEVRVGNTGLVDLLAIDDMTLLSLERGYVRGRDGATGEQRSVNDIRIFRVNLAGADDVSGVESLRDEPLLRPVSKELLLSLGDLLPPPAGLPRDLDNFEAIAVGPRLLDGAASIVLLSDDNFSATQKTRAVLLRVTPVP